MDPDTKDVLLGIAPAFFGLGGTLAGAWIARDATRADRLAEEDNAARESVALLVESAVAAQQWAEAGVPEGVGPPTTKNLRSGMPAARAALLKAGFRFTESSYVLGFVGRLADALEETERRAVNPRKVLVSALCANEAMRVISELLERRRRFRRSRWTRWRLRNIASGDLHSLEPDVQENVRGELQWAAARELPARRFLSWFR